MVVDADQVITEIARFHVEDSDTALTGAVGEDSFITPFLEIGTLALMKKGNSSSRGQGVCCFNCNKMGHITRNFCPPKRQASRGRGGGQAGRFQNRVTAVGNAFAERQ